MEIKVRSLTNCEVAPDGGAISSPVEISAGELPKPSALLPFLR